MDSKEISKYLLDIFKRLESIEYKLDRKLRIARIEKDYEALQIKQIVDTPDGLYIRVQ